MYLNDVLLSASFVLETEFTDRSLCTLDTYMKLGLCWRTSPVTTASHLKTGTSTSKEEAIVEIKTNFLFF